MDHFERTGVFACACLCVYGAAMIVAIVVLSFP
jgi:hypothetical protein